MCKDCRGSKIPHPVDVVGKKQVRRAFKVCPWTWMSLQL